MPRVVRKTDWSKGHISGKCGCPLGATQPSVMYNDKVLAGNSPMVIDGDSYGSHQCTQGNCTEGHLGFDRKVQAGDTKVYINNKKIVRHGDSIACGDEAHSDTTSVIAGGGGTGSTWVVKPPSNKYRERSTPLYNLVVAAHGWNYTVSRNTRTEIHKGCPQNVKPVDLYSEMYETTNKKNIYKNGPPAPIVGGVTTHTPRLPGANLPPTADPKLRKPIPISGFRIQFVKLECLWEGKPRACQWCKGGTLKSNCIYKYNKNPFEESQFNNWKKHLKAYGGLPKGLRLNPTNGKIEGTAIINAGLSYANKKGLLDHNYGTRVTVQICSSNKPREFGCQEVQLKFHYAPTWTYGSGPKYVGWRHVANNSYGYKIYPCPCEIPKNAPPYRYKKDLLRIDDDGRFYCDHPPGNYY